MRLSPPSLWRFGFFVLAFCERWQPKQLVVHEEWQAKQLILLLAWASLVGSAPPSPQVEPSICIVLASRAASLYFGFPGVTASTTCGTSHSTFSSTMLRCVILPRRLVKRGWPQGVLRPLRSRPVEAGPDVVRLAGPETVPWQSMQSISTAARGSV